MHIKIKITELLVVIELIVIFWTFVLFAFISDCGMKSFTHIIIYFKHEFL